MKSRLTHPLTQVVLTSIVTIAVSVGCSASRSAGSPAHAADPPANTQPATPLVSSAAQEKSTCGLEFSQAPVLNGLKLRMTTEEVLALFPDSKEDAELRPQISRPPSQFGVSSFVLKPSKYETRDKFIEVSQISFHLFDGRVSNFTVGYNGPEWPHVDKFVAKFVEGTNLPAVEQWEPYVGMDNLKILKCSDFEIRVHAGGQGGNLNYVLLQDLEAAKTLKERRAKARAAATPSPEKQ